jgi:hypothetical protein
MGIVFFARGISPGQKWQQIFLGREKFHGANGNAQACTQCALFVPFKFRGPWEGFFFSFFPGSKCVPTMFLLSSQWVLIMFSMCSPTCSP